MKKRDSRIFSVILGHTLFILLFFFSCEPGPQNPHPPPLSEISYPTGLVPSDSLALAGVPFATVGDTTIFPALARMQYSPTWSIPVPPPRSQAPNNSCVGWAIGYGFLSYSYGIIDGDPNFSAFNNSNIFSPAFIWNQCNGGKNEGIEMLQALYLIKTQGCSKWDFMGDNTSPTTQPNDAAKENAADYKIATYRRLTADIDNIKFWLTRNYPIVFACVVDKKFESGTDPESFEKKSDGRFVWKSISQPNSPDAHAMVICGYDDQINAFKVLNSWGSTWGNRGYAWIDYQLFQSVTQINNGPEIFLLNARKVVTKRPTKITKTEVETGGQIISEEGEPILERGICFSKMNKPKVSDSTKIMASSTGGGAYVIKISKLKPNNQYFLRAYIATKNGISYGNEVGFKTLPIGAPIVETNNATAIKQTSATIGGNVKIDDSPPLIAKGVCYGISAGPTVDDANDFFVQSKEAGEGSFTLELQKLRPGTVYFARAYAINSKGRFYGNEVSFTTLEEGLPDLTTSSPTSITQNSAISGGVISEEGSPVILERGVCWGLFANPTIANSKTSNGTGTGAFVSNITGLTPNKEYYLRAYATNSKGTGYGPQQVFRTLIEGIPKLTTSYPTSVTKTSAKIGGKVTDSGTSPISSTGICWNANGNPTINDNRNNAQMSNGGFATEVTGLAPGTTYYAKAYATNNSGTGYGNLVVFETHPDSCILTFNWGPPPSYQIVNYEVTASRNTYQMSSTVESKTVCSVPGYATDVTYITGVTFRMRKGETATITMKWVTTNDPNYCNGTWNGVQTTYVTETFECP